MLEIKIALIYLFSLITLVFISCEPNGGDYAYNIQNDSDFPISVKFLPMDSSEITNNIAAKEFLTFYERSKYGRPRIEDKSADFLITFDSIQIEIIPTSKQLIKNVNDSKLWGYTPGKSCKMNINCDATNHTYTFIFRNSDIN